MWGLWINHKWCNTLRLGIAEFLVESFMIDSEDMKRIITFFLDYLIPAISVTLHISPVLDNSNIFIQHSVWSHNYNDRML